MAELPGVHLEALIDQAGRDKVFLCARIAGWTEAAPAYVWRDIAEHLLIDPNWRPISALQVKQHSADIQPGPFDGLLGLPAGTFGF